MISLSSIKTATPKAAPKKEAPAPVSEKKDGATSETSQKTPLTTEKKAEPSKLSLLLHDIPK